MPVVWERLIRFVAQDGRTLRGEPILPHPGFDLGETTEATGLRARVIAGEDIYGDDGEETGGATCAVTDEVVTVRTLLGPLAPGDVPIIRCVGLNYAKHVKETGRTLPPYPSIFYKPQTAVHDHGADVVIPRLVQEEDQADYEGELCLVLARDARDVTPAEARSLVAAYTCGNDVSARKLQKDPRLAGPAPQWGFSKGFDTFAPLGPCLVRPDVLGRRGEEGDDDDSSSNNNNAAPEMGLELQTVVDGEVRQREGIADLIFDCAYLISYLSSGTTLQKGSVIMTGTPGGVGGAMNPPRWLKPGTQMEVKISKIGTLKNGVRFE